MWRKKLRQKKLQFVLVALILFFTAGIFSSCLCFTVETNLYTANYYAKGKSPDVFLGMTGEKQRADFLTRARQNSDFTNVASLKGKRLSEKMNFQGNNIAPNFVYLYALENYTKLPWKLSAVRGAINELGPAYGEIWLTQTYADLKHVKPGDKIEFSNSGHTTLTVSALVNDAVCPASTMGIFPFYVNEKNLNDFSNDTDFSFVSISSKKDSKSVESWLKDLPADLKQTFLVNFTVGDVLMSLNTASDLLGGIGILASLLVFLVSIIIIRFLIKSNLLKEMHSIGIYKALGYTGSQIKGFYLKCYLFVSVLSIPLGALAGIPLGFRMGQISLKYISGFNISSWSFLLAAVCAAFLFILLILNMAIAYRKIDRISPVKALQIGTTSTMKKLTRSVIPHAHLPFAVAVNDIFKHKSISIMFILILTVSFYLSIFFTAINYTCSHLQDNLSIWMGFPRADCFVTGPITDDVVQYVQKDPRVAESISGSPYKRVLINSDGNPYGVDFSKSIIMEWSTFNSGYFWNCYKQGRGPRNSGEIAVSSASVKGSTLGVGDYIELTIGQKKRSYLVTGVYDSMMSGGVSLEILSSDLKKSGNPIPSDSVAIHLKHPEDFEMFQKDIQKHFKTMTVERQYSELAEELKSISDLTSPITEILIAVFILFSLLNIVNLLLTIQLDNRGKFGILKSLGFTTGYICKMNLSRTILLSLISIGLAVAMQLFISPAFFYLLIGVNGLSCNPVILALLIVSVFVMILFISILFCIPLRRISPVDLMEE